MFEINTNCEIKSKIIDGSFLYQIDNFYQDVDEVLNFFSIIDPLIWRKDVRPTNNQILFDDRRHSFTSKHIIKVSNFLSKVCNQSSYFDSDVVTTNFTRFKKDNFNNYESNYWWPHRDHGYNAILYLNKNDTESGTNLYENLNPDEEPPNLPEHYQPWRNKNNYRIIESIKPKYNRMVLFDGYKFFHGMNICNDDYFSDTYRMNQVFFFTDNGDNI
jgi:hypothetical protein